MTKRCPTCGLVKDYTEFYANRAQRDGLSCQCKVCFKALNRSSQKRNPDRVRRNHLAYLARHPEKVIEHRRKNQAARKANPLIRDMVQSAALARYYRDHANDPVVYFIGPADRTLGLVKIGSTDNLPVRVAMLKCGSPVALEVYAAIRCEDRQSALRLEREIQRNYKDLRDHGEWYRLDPDLEFGIEMAAA